MTSGNKRFVDKGVPAVHLLKHSVLFDRNRRLPHVILNTGEALIRERLVNNRLRRRGTWMKAARVWSLPRHSGPRAARAPRRPPPRRAPLLGSDFEIVTWTCNHTHFLCSNIGTETFTRRKLLATFHVCDSGSSKAKRLGPKQKLLTLLRAGPGRSVRPKRAGWPCWRARGAGAGRGRASCAGAAPAAPRRAAAGATPVPSRAPTSPTPRPLAECHVCTTTATIHQQLIY